MSDMLALLRSLAEGVRGMGIGDPDAGERVEASDMIRWAVNEIARLRLTDAERDWFQWVIDTLKRTGQHTGAWEGEQIFKRLG